MPLWASPGLDTIGPLAVESWWSRLATQSDGRSSCRRRCGPCHHGWGLAAYSRGCCSSRWNVAGLSVSIACIALMVAVIAEGIVAGLTGSTFGLAVGVDAVPVSLAACCGDPWSRVAMSVAGEWPGMLVMQFLCRRIWDCSWNRCDCVWSSCGVAVA
jgi:hypothetical protein